MGPRTLIPELWTAIFDEYAGMSQKNQYIRSRALSFFTIGRFILAGKEALLFGLMNSIHNVQIVTLCGYSVEFVIQSENFRFLFIRNFLVEEFKNGKFPTMLINAAQRAEVVHCEFFHPYMDNFFEVMLNTEKRKYLKIYCRDKMFGPVLGRTLKTLIDRGVTVDLDVVTLYIKQFIEGYRLNACTFSSGAVALENINFYMKEANLELFHPYGEVSPYLRSIERLSIGEIQTQVETSLLQFFHDKFPNLKKLSFNVVTKEYLSVNNALVPLLVNAKTVAESSPIPILEIKISVRPSFLIHPSASSLETLQNEGFDTNLPDVYKWQIGEKTGNFKSIVIHPSTNTDSWIN
ncbi:hypothetical protein FO519_005834 [Halicephalobus sp. NKZ332]|nr:hypothetical protein FO519_005834 [Halicephalobus sp. NKZ332]